MKWLFNCDDNTVRFSVVFTTSQTRESVVVEEEHLTRLPVIYNVNIGHAKPIGILPYGIETELNCEKKTIRFLESPTV